jgi:hypothetical protein
MIWLGFGESGEGIGYGRYCIGEFLVQVFLDYKGKGE